MESTEDVSYLIAILAQRRKDLRLSQEEVGLIIGKHQSWLSTVEMGTIKPSWDQIKAIADALSVGVSMVIAFEEVEVWQ